MHSLLGLSWMQSLVVLMLIVESWRKVSEEWWGPRLYIVYPEDVRAHFKIQALKDTVCMDENSKRVTTEITVCTWQLLKHSQFPIQYKISPSQALKKDKTDKTVPFRKLRRSYMFHLYVSYVWHSSDYMCMSWASHQEGICRPPFQTNKRDISSQVLSDQTEYFKLKHDVFLT